MNIIQYLWFIEFIVIFWCSLLLWYPPRLAAGCVASLCFHDSLSEGSLSDFTVTSRSAETASQASALTDLLAMLESSWDLFISRRFSTGFFGLRKHFLHDSIPKWWTEPPGWLLWELCRSEQHPHQAAGSTERWVISRSLRSLDPSAMDSAEFAESKVCQNMKSKLQLRLSTFSSPCWCRTCKIIWLICTWF